MKKILLYLGIPILLAIALIGGWLFFYASYLWLEPTSTLKPDKVEEITEQRILAKKMFRSILTQVPNGMISALLHRQYGLFYLKINDSDKTLHELCQQEETCVGGFYASVMNQNEQGEILHRIYKGKEIQIACSWVESYSTEFEGMNTEQRDEVIGRAWHWVKVCFEE
jgi:hypothetical protein